MYRHEQSVRAFGVVVLVVAVAWIGGMVVYHITTHKPVGLPTYLGGTIGLALAVAAVRYVAKGGVWRLTISPTDITWTCPDFNNRTLILDEIAHYSVRQTMGGDSTETWLVLKNGERARVPPNCIGDEAKTWAALAAILPRRDESIG